MRLFYKTRKLLLIAATMFSTGMAFAQTEEYNVVWKQDFEDANTYTDGWSVGGNTTFSQVTLSNGSTAVKINTTASGNRTSSYSFTDANFTSAEKYKFEFDWGLSSGGDRTTTLTFKADNESSKLFVLTNPAYTPSSTIYGSDGTTVLGTITNDTRTLTTPSVISHFLIEGNAEGVTLTVTRDGETVLDAVKLSETLVHITGISVEMARSYAHMVFDEFKLSVPGVSEGITDPSISITGVSGINRTITIEPGVGTVGTAAESTYYTTDGTSPSKENGTEYTEPFVISATTTIKAISYLPDGTASEITTFEAEAGTEIPLSEEIINLTFVDGEEGVKHVCFDSIYSSEDVFLQPEATVTCTFNGDFIALPYTAKTAGTIIATVSADGYASMTQSFTVDASYQLTHHVDFTLTDTLNVTELLGENWSVTLDTLGYCLNSRWGNWERNYSYYNASCSSTQLTDFLVTTDKGRNLLIGYGVGQNALNKDGTSKATNYWISNPTEGEIAVYEVNETRRYQNNPLVAYNILYADDPTLSHAIYDCAVLAKVSVYTPVRELVIDDNSVECADFAPEYESYSKITYNRDFTADYYYLMVLPFAPDETSLQNYSFYKLSSVADDAVTFAEETAPVANTPYLCCLKEGATTTNSITGGPTTVSTEVNNETVGTWTLVGSLKNETVNSTSSDNYLLHPINKTLHKVTSSLTVYPYTAYLQKSLTGIEVAPATMRLFISGPTGIKEISVDRVEGFGTGCFDLQGRPISKPMKGQIYIKDGKKIIH